MKFSKLNIFTILTLVVFLGGCSTAPTSEVERESLQAKAAATIERFKKQDPGMKLYFDTAKAYAVFPTVGKGAVGIGGAYGKGIFYEGGKAVGYCDLTQGSIGLQLGGQAYSEVVFFQTETAIRNFKGNSLEFAAQASAVAATAGASADADYSGGVLVFTATKGGLMYEASIGGQKFEYVPMN